VESQSGALSIVLTFDNDNDIDLHVITPSGRHIFYGEYYDEFTDYDAFFGLDNDSNASCVIDGLKNENVVISQEFIEPGDYKVYVNLYSNCDVTSATKWYCTVRYNGELVNNQLGDNPATGVYPVDAQEHFDIYDELNNLVMTFRVPTSKAFNSRVHLPEPPDVPLPKQCKERTKIYPRIK
jgi:hypothetical protein